MVEKIVRMQLSRGRHGEFLSVKHIIHENIGMGTAHLYRPLLEYERSGQFTAVSDHEWDIDYYAGLLTWQKAQLDVSLCLSFYRYVGRVGATQHMLNPSTDTLTEGVVNRFMKKGDVQEWAAEVVARLDSDAVPEGSHNKYAQSRETIEGWTEAQFSALTTDRVPEGGVNKYAQSRETIEGWTDGKLRRLTTDDIAEGVLNFYGDGGVAMPAPPLTPTVAHVPQPRCDVRQHVDASSGVLEGSASIQGGSMSGVDHIAIGGPAGTCPFTVYAPDGEAHIALIPGRGDTVEVTARNDGALHSKLIAADTVRVDRMYAMGIDNAYAGVQRTGDIVGANHIEAASLRVRGKRLCLYASDCADVRSTRIYAVDGEVLGALGAAGQCSSIHIWTAEVASVRVVTDTHAVTAAFNADDYMLTISSTGVSIDNKKAPRFVAFEG